MIDKLKRLVEIYRTKDLTIDHMILDLRISRDVYYKLMRIDNYESKMKGAVRKRLKASIETLLEENS